MPIEPLQVACLHMATAEEKDRDPIYVLCGAGASQPCTWAKRYDGVEDPPFHSERLEAAMADEATKAAEEGRLRDTLDRETFREIVLDTGLV